MWEDEFETMQADEAAQQVVYAQSFRFSIPPVALILWDKLMELGTRCDIELGDALADHNSKPCPLTLASDPVCILWRLIVACWHAEFANNWPVWLVWNMKEILKKHMMQESNSGRRLSAVASQPLSSQPTGSQGPQRLRLSDRRLQISWEDSSGDPFHRCCFVQDGEDTWNLWSVTDLVGLMVDVANSVSQADDDWETSLREKVRRDSETEREGAAFENCCSGCLRMANVSDDADRFELERHPLFENRKLCRECHGRYEDEQHWPLDQMRKEENCRCCGWDDHLVTNCDSCPASFCHGCIAGHCRGYGSEEFAAILRSDGDPTASWKCFLCRSEEDGPGLDQPFEVCPDALATFRSNRRRARVVPSQESEDSEDDSSDDETFGLSQQQSMEVSDDDDDDDTGVTETEEAPRASTRATSFDRVSAATVAQEVHGRLVCSDT